MNYEYAIQVDQLAKSYRTFKKQAGFAAAFKSFFKRDEIVIEAVKPISFTLKKGEFVGLLGPNGAGKTTTLKMLTGLIPPSSGVATAFQSFDTKDRNPRYLKRIGMVMGQRNQLHPDLPAMDSLRLAQAIYDVSEARFHQRLQTCLDLFDIKDKLEVPVRKLSLGERMKMELILAILHEPELLFLDEPTIGLDFNAARQIRGFLKHANESLGITVVLTSHYTKDIEELCRRVIVINHGSIVFDGPLTGLDQRLHGEKQIKIKFQTTEDAKIAEDQAQTALVTDHLSINCFDNELRVSVAPGHIPKTLKALLALNACQDALDIMIDERSLEDIFTDLYQAQSKPTSGVP